MTYCDPRIHEAMQAALRDFAKATEAAAKQMGDLQDLFSKQAHATWKAGHGFIPTAFCERCGSWCAFVEKPLDPAKGIMFGGSVKTCRVCGTRLGGRKPPPSYMTGFMRDAWGGRR